MTTEFHCVGLIARPQPDAAVLDSVRVVAEHLQKHGLQVVFDDPTGVALQVEPKLCVSREQLAQACDLLVVVGGDGSLLGVGRDLSHTQIPVLGVNRGGLGFLADIAPDQIEAQLTQVLAGQYLIEEHFLLDAWVMRNGEQLVRSPALNDVVVHPSSVARMLEFSLYVDDEFVYDQRSDGLIIASPTGSTAYALSAGGPIMHPSLDAIVIVPMFPHTLTSRPIVVGGGSKLRITLGDAGYPTAKMVCDSQIRQEFVVGDEVHIAKYEHSLRMLYPIEHSFYESCRSKLDWASRLGGKS